MKSIYLDYAAATPVDRRVLRAMQPYFSEQFANPSAIYLAGRSARQSLEQARSTVARLIGARPGEIVFTSGATESNNLAIAGLMEQHPKAQVLVSSIEHESVLAPAGRYDCRYLPVDKYGLIKLDELAKMINDKTVLISAALVNNEIGTVQPVDQIAQQIKQVRAQRLKKKIKLPLYLHTDAAQAGNLFDLHVSRLGVDLMSLNGAKIYGPKQTGALYVRAGIGLRPLIVGGGQEHGIRSGTENLPGFVGFAEALRWTQTHRTSQLKKTAELAAHLLELLEEQVPGFVLNGHRKLRSPHILNISLPGYDGERLMMELDERGVEVAVGSACSASSDQPSHVLSAIGLSDEIARASLRFSFGRPTTRKDLEIAVKYLSEIVRRADD